MLKSTLLKTKHSKLVNIYDKSLYYKDFKDHSQEEMKRLTDMGYMKVNEDASQKKDNDYRWLKKKLNHIKTEQT